MKPFIFPFLLCPYLVLAQEGSFSIDLTSLVNNRAFAIRADDADFSGSSGKSGCIRDKKSSH
jgi:hypothetical protein